MPFSRRTLAMGHVLTLRHERDGVDFLADLVREYL